MISELIRSAWMLREWCEMHETCEGCPFISKNDCGLRHWSPSFWSIPPKIEVNVFDEEEIHENVTVQILRNSVTGEESIGWWDNEVKE